MRIAKNEEAQRFSVSGKLLRRYAGCRAAFTFHGAAVAHLSIGFAANPNFCRERYVLAKAETLPRMLNRRPFDFAG